MKTLLTGKAYTPSYATDVKATIRREQKRLREQERQRQMDGQEAPSSKVKPFIKATVPRGSHGLIASMFSPGLPDRALQMCHWGY